MDLFDKHIGKTAFTAVKAKKESKPANTKKPVAKKPSASSTSSKPGEGGAQTFQGTQFSASLKTKAEQTTVSLKTTREDSPLEFKELAKSFIDRVKLGPLKDDAKSKKANEDLFDRFVEKQAVSKGTREAIKRHGEGHQYAKNTAEVKTLVERGKMTTPGIAGMRGLSPLEQQRMARLQQANRDIAAGVTSGRTPSGTNITSTNTSKTNVNTSSNTGNKGSGGTGKANIWARSAKWIGQNKSKAGLIGVGALAVTGGAIGLAN